jgi:uncharacterized membrane protein
MNEVEAQRSPAHTRYWELDAARGIAIVMMIVFHTVYDLNYFGIVSFPVHDGFWRWFALLTASLFVFIVGVSLSISYARTRDRLPGFALYKKYLLRGSMIFALGMGITLVTWLVLGEGYILFGILHLIGLSIIIAPLFFRFPRLSLVLGLLFILEGVLITHLNGPLWLAWIGIHPVGFYSIDYEPLFPWFGLVLLGLFAGSTLYPGGIRRWPISRSPNRCTDSLSFLGRHSLVIYLVHQPLIIGMLFLIFGL